MYHGGMYFGIKAMDKLLSRSKNPNQTLDASTVNMSLFQSETVTAENTLVECIPDDDHQTEINNYPPSESIQSHSSLNCLTPVYSAVLEDIEVVLDDPDEILITELRSEVSTVQQGAILFQHGYKYIDRICETLQGELFSAKVYPNSFHQASNSSHTIILDTNMNTFLVNTDSSYLSKNKVSDEESIVIVKKTDKKLYEEGVSIADEENITYCVHEDALKEADILRYLTVDNKNGDYIVRFIDFFETGMDYYLVMENTQHNMSFKDFINKAYKFMISKQMKYKHYVKIIKYLFWQLFATMHWLHADMNC